MSRFIQVSMDLASHPKAMRLRAKLQNRLACWYLVELWTWCVRYAPDGDLTDFGSETIEEALGWTLNPGVLFAALRECGWIDSTEDGRLVVHDWMEHQGGWLAKLESNKKKIRKWRKAKNKSPVTVTVTEPKRTVTEPRGNGSETDNRTGQDRREQDRTEQENKPDSSEALRAREPVVFTFPVVGGAEFWELRKSEHLGLAKAFPGVDVAAQYEKALVWLKANPTKRKTPRGMPQFLFGWMERVQNRGTTPANGTQSGAGPPQPSRNVQVLGSWLEAKTGG